MKPLFLHFLRRAAVLGLFSWTFLVGLGSSSQAAIYKVGDIVSDFTLYARRPITNDLGQVTPAGSPVHLTDFAGKIVFIEFFYYW
jgi:hypothetical protein